MAVNIKLPDNVLLIYAETKFGAIVVFTNEQALGWRKGEGWIPYDYGGEILSGKEWDYWEKITEEQALARIKEIEKYGYEYKSKAISYTVSSDFDDI
jgi:hypothetical protein